MVYNPHEEKFHEDLERGYMLTREEKLTAITLDESIQMRVSTDAGKVDEYKEKWSEGCKFPPIDIFYDEATRKQLIADGIHRYLAALAAGLERIPVRVFRGTRRDAILHACRSNGEHGHARTERDLRKAILTLLLDSDWGKRSNYWIAEQCNCKEKRVRDIRDELARNAIKSGSSSTTNKTVPENVENLPQNQDVLNYNHVLGRGENLTDTSSHYVLGRSENPKETQEHTPNTRTYTNKYGKVSEMKINNIGKKKESTNEHNSRERDSTQTTKQTLQPPAPHASKNRTNPLQTQTPKPSFPATQVVTCISCKEEFHEEDCFASGEQFYCGDCASHSRCSGCEEEFVVQSLAVDGELLYCQECWDSLATTRKAKQEKLLQNETKEETTKGSPTIQPSGSEHWNTPPELLEKIQLFAGGPIALDPCWNACSKTEPFLQFTKEENGLEKDWAKELESRRLHGLVYVNPPYDQETLERVATHCVMQHRKKLEILSLVPCKMDQEWWQSTVFETVSAVCFVKGRIKFWEDGTPKTGAPMPCAFLYWGSDTELFAQVFSSVGRVLEISLLREAESEKYGTFKLIQGGSNE